MIKRIPPPLIGVTMGDPAGIGPETIVKALPKIRADHCSLVVIGNRVLLEKAAQQFAPRTEILQVADLGTLPKAEPNQLLVLDPFGLDLSSLVYGQPQALAGEMAYQAILLAAQLAAQGDLAALVTAPICKEALHLAGHRFDGHTGLLAHLTQTTRYRMTFSTRNLRIIHTTAHLGLAEACGQITEARVFETIQIGVKHLQQLGIKAPRVAVCGLNPHASEAGIFGSEDLEQVLPGVKRAQAAGWDVTGPLPGDAVFIQAFKGRYDLVVAQYHDQGHIPGKLMAFETGVNVTVGLPFVRCSPDHGTAFDIAGQGVANPGNLIEAIQYSLLLVK